MDDPVPIRCSLREAEMTDRAKLVAELGEDLLTIEAGTERAVLRFAAHCRERVEEFARQEAACCPFFDFDVLEQDDEIELRIAVPLAGEPFLRELVAGFAAGWGALV